MNDYAHNIQFNHWNELLIQKECGNLDFFHCFFKSYRFFLISGKETFPKFGQIWKLFRDVYHKITGNIHPCTVFQTCFGLFQNSFSLFKTKLLAMSLKSYLLIDTMKRREIF